PGSAGESPWTGRTPGRRVPPGPRRDGRSRPRQGRLARLRCVLDEGVVRGRGAAAGPAAEPRHLAPLTAADAGPILHRAISHWVAARLEPGAAAHLANVAIRVEPLPAPYLGLAGAGIIWIDPTAQGYGWFIDSAPNQGASVPSDLIDLRTVLGHELGHELGLQD